MQPLERLARRLCILAQPGGEEGVGGEPVLRRRRGRLRHDLAMLEIWGRCGGDVGETCLRYDLAVLESALEAARLLAAWRWGAG